MKTIQDLESEWNGMEKHLLNAVLVPNTQLGRNARQGGHVSNSGKKILLAGLLSGLGEVT